METSQYLDLFISEGQDHLQEMNRALLALEEQPDTLAHLEALFRAAHTLKGMSAALGFQSMASLAHSVEDVLDALRHKERRLTPDLADLLFRCLDDLAEMLHRVAAGEAVHDGVGTVDVAGLQALLRSAHQSPAPGPSPDPALVPTPPGSPAPGWEVQVSVVPDCVLKGPRAFLVLKRLATVAAVLGSDPPEADLRTGAYEEQFRVFLAPTASPEALQRAATSVAEIAAAAVVQRETEPAAVPPSPAPAADVMLLAPVTDEPGPPVPSAVAPVVRIKVALLDQLLEVVADVVMHRSQLAQVARRQALPDLDEAVEAYAGILNRLQQTVLAMRMTPVAHVFSRFPRMVRDLAREQNKELRFEMEGTELELDRTILEKITDPLVHLLRNAVDHGVESPDERRQAGKPLPACIRLQTQRVQDKAVIEVQDDGPGMSPPKIARLAVERGLITPQAAAEMDPAAILDLVCLPGFSTRTQVSDVSGRGVGMDAVKATMDEIGGTLEIVSQVGRGCCFRLTFPLTMAILPALLVQVGGATYALPLTHVARTIEPLPEEVRMLHQQPVLCWGEHLLPLARLADLLGAAGAGTAPAAHAALPVVVVRRGRQQVGFIVDEILGKEDIVLKPLGTLLQPIQGLAGATIRGEGEIVLVLDVASLAGLLSRDDSANGVEGV